MNGEQETGLLDRRRMLRALSLGGAGVLLGCTDDLGRPVPASLVQIDNVWARQPVVLVPFGRMEEAVNEWHPGWKASSANFCNPGLLDYYGGRERVLRLHALHHDPPTPCRLEGTFRIPKTNPVLELGVAVNDHPPGLIGLRVEAVETIEDTELTHAERQPRWFDFSWDLSTHAGRTITIIIEGWPNRWGYSTLNVSHARVRSL